MHEEIRKDTLKELSLWAQKGLKGEIVVVLDRLVQEKHVAGEDEIDTALNKCLKAGLSARDASAAVAALLEVKKRPVYQRCMELQKL